ncbi:MAG: hypothetical protein ACK4I8_02910 [Armatimonadota bacterium]
MGLKRPDKLTLRFVWLSTFRRGWAAINQRNHSQRIEANFSNGSAIAFTLESATSVNGRGEIP